MRVIAGLYKGRQLKPARHLDIRPATDRVKETIFNVLQARIDFEDIKVLDLFAGTGSLGIESASRGANSVILIDNFKESIELINTNIELLKCGDVCKTLKTDALRFIETSKEKFNLIFADPPYAYEMTITIPKKIFSNKILNDNGFLIIEHQRNLSFELTNDFVETIKKEFGNTTVTFFKHKTMEKQ
jgi:16S rRNA (guanine(966)-N(2))-methyltransferase RsmD